MRLLVRLSHALRFGAVLALSLFLAGCADASPSTQVALPAASAAALPSVAAPTAMRTPEPSLKMTATSTPTATPTETVTPAYTASPTATPTWTLTPTPPTDSRLALALQYQTNGQYNEAIDAYLAALEEGLAPAEAREAHYRVAESHLLNRDYAQAARLFADYMTSYRGDVRVPRAALMAGRAYQANDDCPQAIPFYDQYLAQEGILADLVHEWIGDCHVVNRDFQEAINAYRQALELARDTSAQAGLREKVAQAYVALEQYAAAVGEYDTILQSAREGNYRARIEYLAGRALAAAGQTDLAHARYRHAVDRYPEAEYAYLSLIELVQAGVQANEFQRGLVDYYAGDQYPDAYAAAIAAFDRYLSTQPASKADEALYRKALAQRGSDQVDAALGTLEMLIADAPGSPWAARARWEKGETLVRMGANDEAVDAYREVAVLHPSSELAPKALWQAARLREREGAFGSAAKLFRELRDRYPAAENADQALWRAGLNYYRAGDQAAATANWRAVLTNYPESPYRAASLYWLGKLAVSPVRAEETEYWDQLVDANPLAYYALRVQQIRAGESITATRFVTAAIGQPVWDPVQAEAEILIWLGDWTQVPPGTRLVSLPSALSQRTDLERGRALLAVGLRRAALNAFDKLRAEAWSDPVALARLAFFFRDQGFHGLAARSALRLAALWPGGSIVDAPLALRHLAYPLAYTDLISAEAQARGLDPLLLAALIRQESLFEPVAQSYAGARGLGQVMPATGEGIARSLGMDDFVLDDLYRPSISIKFGAYYLAVQMKRFEDQILVALAAYNGGPGNALHWLEAGGNDLDLFVEMISASQSRRYLQTVYEQYNTYEQLYRPGRSGE